MPDIYVPDQIASVYFDSRRDLKTAAPPPQTLRERFFAKSHKDKEALSIGSADHYLAFLGYHPGQIEVFRSHIDRAVMNHLSAQEPRGIRCEFNDRYYLGLHLDKQCFSLSPTAVKDMRKDFIHSLNAERMNNYKLLWAKTDDFDVNPATGAQKNIAKMAHTA